MKLTNILLIILICLVAFQTFPDKQRIRKSVASEDKITVRPKETKAVTAISKNENPVKHSTTFRNYVDSDGRSNQSLSHNIRIGKEYYVSGSLGTRENSYGERDTSGTLSITRYW